MKQLRSSWLCIVIASLIVPMWAQAPISLGPIHGVSYDHGSGFVSYVAPCKQPVAGLPPALCWVMRAGELHLVDGKLQPSKLSIGYLSISADRVFFRPEERGAVTIDFAPASVVIKHAAGKPYAVLISGSQSFVIADLPLCPTCPPKAQATMPDGLNFDDEYNDLAASLQHFDAVLKRITDIAGQAPDQNQVASLSSGDSEQHVLSRVTPEYPAVAKAAHIEGTVVIQAVLSKEGAVTEAQAVSGPELLRSAALAAVTQWKYRPFLLNGSPVPVRTTINVNFMLGPAASAGQAEQP